MRNIIVMNYKAIILLSIVLFSLFGCEKELDFRPDDFPPLLVLNGIVEQDSIFCINVSRTASLNEIFMCVFFEFSYLAGRLRGTSDFRGLVQGNC